MAPHAEDEGIAAIGPQTTGGIPLRQGRQREELAGEPLARLGEDESEAAAVGHALDHLEEHRIVGHRLERGSGDGRHALVHVPAGGDPSRREDLPVHRNVVEQARKRAPLVSLHRGADPDLVVVHDRRLGCRAAVVPKAIHGPAVEEALDRVGHAKSIRDRHVVPAGARLEAPAARPAMKVATVAGGVVGAAKQKAHCGHAILAGQSQSPVLIVGGEAWPAGAALADDVDLLAGGDLKHVHPGLERDRVAVLKHERWCRGCREITPTVAEGRRPIASRHRRMPRRLRPRLAEDHVAHDLSFDRFRRRHFVGIRRRDVRGRH